MSRPDHRQCDELRPVLIDRNFIRVAPGSVRISAGNTSVLCTASFVESVPNWMKQQEGGWLTAEYRMLPCSTIPRSERKDRPDGRASEIQRLIGRSLRSVVDLKILGPRTIYIDCDVLQADGGTRTLAITGAWIALYDAIKSLQAVLPPVDLLLRDSVAAVSVGLIDGQARLDLCYLEDVSADVDMNLVMTGSGRFIEIQGTGEHATFSGEQLNLMLTLGRKGIEQLSALQPKLKGV